MQSEDKSMSRISETHLHSSASCTSRWGLYRSLRSGGGDRSGFPSLPWKRGWGCWWKFGPTMIRLLSTSPWRRRELNLLGHWVVKLSQNVASKNLLNGMRELWEGILGWDWNCRVLGSCKTILLSLVHIGYTVAKKRRRTDGRWMTDT